MTTTNIIQRIHQKFERTVNQFQTLDRKDVLFIYRQAMQETAKEILEEFTVVHLKLEVDKLFNYITDGGRNVQDAKLMLDEKTGFNLFSLKQKVDELWRKDKTVKVEPKVKLKLVNQTTYRIEKDG